MPLRDIVRGVQAIACALSFATLFALPVAPAIAAGDPEKPIRLLIPFPPGGGTDLLARALQDQLEKALGAGVIIDNRGGAGGTLGVTLAARAAPDGYTLLVTSVSYTLFKYMAKILKNPDTVKRLAADGLVVIGNPPEEFGAFMRTEIAEWSKLIREMKL